MNISDKNRKHNFAFLIFSLTLASCLIGGTGFFLKEIFSGESSGISKSEKSCKEVLKMAGLNFKEEKKGQLRISVETNRNIEQLTFKSGVVIASCPSYTVHDFCAGAGCPTPGMAFTLTLKEL